MSSWRYAAISCRFRLVKLEFKSGRYQNGTDRIGILDLSPNIQIISTDDGNDGFGVDHVIILLLAEELIIALHDAIETLTKEVHILRVHNMSKGVLIFGPYNSALNHCFRVVTHSLESGKRLATEGRIWVSVRVGTRSAGGRVRRLICRFG